MLGILEMDLIVLVSKSCSSNISFIPMSKTLYYSSSRLLFVICLTFLDINECSSKPCHHNATCTDNEGSFDCECNVGFSGNGLNCSSKWILF
jgi:hypothetical protein